MLEQSRQDEISHFVDETFRELNGIMQGSPANGKQQELSDIVGDRVKRYYPPSKEGVASAISGYVEGYLLAESKYRENDRQRSKYKWRHALTGRVLGALVGVLGLAPLGILLLTSDHTAKAASPESIDLTIPYYLAMAWGGSVIGKAMGALWGHIRYDQSVVDGFEEKAELYTTQKNTLLNNLKEELYGIAVGTNPPN